MSAASSSSVRPRTSSPRPWPRLFNLDLLFHTHLTCGEDLAKDLCSDLRCAALMQGLQKARLGSSSPAWLLCCAGTQEASHFQGERGAALNFHGNKAVTKAEHELFPWQQLRRSLQAQLRGQAVMPGRAACHSSSDLCCRGCPCGPGSSRCAL